jgi:hypothetical protein
LDNFNFFQQPFPITKQNAYNTHAKTDFLVGTSLFNSTMIVSIHILIFSSSSCSSPFNSSYFPLSFCMNPFLFD